MGPTQPMYASKVKNEKQNKLLSYFFAFIRLVKCCYTDHSLCAGRWAAGRECTSITSMHPIKEIEVCAIQIHRWLFCYCSIGWGNNLVNNNDIVPVCARWKQHANEISSLYSAGKTNWRKNAACKAVKVDCKSCVIELKRINDKYLQRLWQREATV